jgi:hypothetical protein
MPGWWFGGCISIGLKNSEDDEIFEYFFHDIFFLFLCWCVFKPDIWLLIFASLGDGIPGFPLLFIEVVEVAGVDGTLLIEVPGLGIIFVNDREVLGIDV